MKKKRVHILGRVPIPVGHQACVTWYTSESTSIGFLGGKKTESRRLVDPVIVDLDTGIRYGVWEHYVAGGGFRNGIINVDEHTLRSELVVAEQISGKVTGCSIVDIRLEGLGGSQAETEIEIVDDQAGPFR